MANKLAEIFTRLRIGTRPSDRSEMPIVEKKDELVNQIEDAKGMSGTPLYQIGQLNQFRTLATDRQSMYQAFDEMKQDSVISAALEIYADNATQYDEQGRIIWVESDSDEIAKAGNRLLKILEIPERAWKHIYQACLYGDCYLKLYRDNNFDKEDDKDQFVATTRVVNDKVTYKGHQDRPNYIEYVEDVNDPSTVFDLRKRGKTAGFIEVKKTEETHALLANAANLSFGLQDISIYLSYRFVHVIISDTIERNPEEVTIDLGDGNQVTYQSAKGKSILQDVYPIQKELQLLEDTLLLNRLTRSPLIRLLEIELGDMPKKEVNAYLRRVKQLIEQHIAMDKDTGYYKSYNSPGPIDNILYIPVRNGKGSITVNNLGGDVNIRDIADVDYFNNKRAGALKIPKAYLGEDMEGSGLSNGGSLTRLSYQFARTIKRIQTAYIRAIKTMLNLFFIDKKLDYVNKFEVRMTSPSTQEDLERNELVQGNVDLISNIMDLTESLEGDTQKKILNYLVANVLKMPEIAEMIEEDETPPEEIDIEGGAGGFGGPDLGGSNEPVDISAEFEGPESGGESGPAGGESPEGGFSEEDFQEFED